MTSEPSPAGSAASERGALLAWLDEWLEIPMLLLGMAWLALLVIELATGLTRFLEALGTTIWIVFVLEFAGRLLLAPHRLRYLRRNWLTALALLIPALRVLRVARFVRILRAARAARGVRLARLVGAINRGVRTLGATMRRRGLGYVVATTMVVALAGAAGMYAFERDVRGSGLADFGSALWWTAMALTTMGSDYWPRTAEGRILCLLLAVYAFAVFGYITAALASYFVGRDADRGDAEVAGQATLDQLREEVAALRAELGPVIAAVQTASPPARRDD